MSSIQVTPTEPSGWKQRFTADDGTVFYDEDARREADAHFARMEVEHRAALRNLRPAGRRAYAAYKRTGVRPIPSSQPLRTVSSHTGPRQRRERRTSSPSRAGPKSDDDPGEPEPPRRPLGARHEWAVWATQRSRELRELQERERPADAAELQLSFGEAA
jgi:hypothetical protein